MREGARAPAGVGHEVVGRMAQEGEVRARGHVAEGVLGPGAGALRAAGALPEALSEVAGAALL
eukprot:7096431-Alexandrium_andersonii.AAC.1